MHWLLQTPDQLLDQLRGPSDPSFSANVAATSHQALTLRLYFVQDGKPSRMPDQPAYMLIAANAPAPIRNIVLGALHPYFQRGLLSAAELQFPQFCWDTVLDHKYPSEGPDNKPRDRELAVVLSTEPSILLIPLSRKDVEKHTLTEDEQGYIHACLAEPGRVDDAKFQQYFCDSYRTIMLARQMLDPIPWPGAIIGVNEEKGKVLTFMMTAQQWRAWESLVRQCQGQWPRLIDYGSDDEDEFTVIGFMMPHLAETMMLPHQVRDWRQIVAGEHGRLKFESKRYAGLKKSGPTMIKRR